MNGNVLISTTIDRFGCNPLHLEQKSIKPVVYICPMCNITSLEKQFDIDHIYPLHTAKTEKDIIALYELNNLDTLCANCNRYVKGSKIPPYVM